jgi:EAL domain-containing protein (putative c-di-GMP-specific phosphodiesterase class I)
MGGDEFVIILGDLISPHQDVERVVERVNSMFDRPITQQGVPVTVTVSIGIALAPQDGATPDILMKNADVAMYQAKATGPGHHQFFTNTVLHLVNEREELEESLRQALQQGDFQLYYQPLYEVYGDRLVGMETYLRWRHPELGLIPPLQFIPAAEETEIAGLIASWVLETACRQMAAWHREGHENLKLVVNVSPHYFEGSGFLQSVDDALSRSGLSPDALELDIPEHFFVRYSDRLWSILEQLQQRRVRLAVDDVGTSHHSLHYLQHAVFKAVKIDGTFLHGLEGDQSNLAVVRSIIDTAHQAGVKVIAECVEQPGQLTMLKALGCDQYQGYLAGRPMPAEESLQYVTADSIGGGYRQPMAISA